MDLYLTRSKRSYKLFLHFEKPECIGGQAWVSKGMVQLDDNDYDIIFEDSPIKVKLIKTEE